VRFITGLLCLFSIFQLFASNTYGSSPSAAVIYSNPPDEILHLYDWIVVDPTTFNIKQFKDEKFYIKKHAKLIAYLSIGEIEKNELFSISENFKKTCIIGENKQWKSKILDIRNPTCLKYLKEKLNKLDDYDGFMFDTIDSYQIALPENEWKSYEKAEIDFIKNFKKSHPEKLLLLNRPFNIIEKIYPYIDGVIAESLYYGVDNKTNYTRQDKENTNWLLRKLNEIKKFNLPIIVIDYIPKNKSILRKTVAKKIEKEGFIPWITDKHLKGIGEGIFHFIPRKIALVSNINYQDSLLHTMVQLPLEWLGFVPVFYNSSNLPELDDSYTGAIVWLERNPSNEEKRKIEKWIKKYLSKGKNIFIIDPEILENRFLSDVLKIKIYNNNSTSKAKFKTIFMDGSYNFEIQATSVLKEVLKQPIEGKPLIKLKNDKNQIYVPAAIISWGGYSDSEYLIRTIFNDDLWVVNPFKLFSKIFGTMPAPDITTENGKRILTVHIDGDGFDGTVSFAKDKIPAQIIEEKLIKRYPEIPHTASVIVGQIKDKEKLVKIAKSIFSLKNVEAASHSFSHPFSWKDFYLLEQGVTPDDKKELKYGYYLNIKGYTPSLKEEIIGSIDWINKNLLPKNKKVKVFLWTGDCVPIKDAVKLTYKAKIYNVNGGDTTATKNHPFLSCISPMGINIGNYFQIYAPIQNENIYTQSWTIPDGYKKVIQTFKITDKPYRLKPISIYYHWDSGAYKASLKTLEDVYSWALNQNPIPLFLSEYAQKVLEFRTTALAAKGNRWIIKNSGNLRTLRVPLSFGYPDIQNSKGVIGYKKINNQLYIHLDSSGDYEIVFSKNDLNPFYIVESNGIVTSYQKSNGKFKISFKTYKKNLQITLLAEDTCDVKTSENAELIKRGKITIVKFKENKGSIEADCKY